MRSIVHHENVPLQSEKKKIAQFKTTTSAFFGDIFLPFRLLMHLHPKHWSFHPSLFVILDITTEFLPLVKLQVSISNLKNLTTA